MSYTRKIFLSRLKESCFQRFKDNLHLSFSKIPLHLQKAVIHDMEIEFGIGWSIKKGKNKCLKIARDSDATKQRR